jgi:hypothetical protein
MSDETENKPMAQDAKRPVERLVMPDAHDSATKLYCIPMMVKTQKEPLDKYCFGSCGKISMGAIEIAEVGPCWVCTHDDCPHEKGHTDIIGSSGMTGEPVCIRGLEA